jgi:hypothetical protein
MHSRTNRALHPGDMFRGLQSVDISASESSLPFPEGPDPKTWKGMSLILIPRLRPCSRRLKGKAMIYILTVSVRIKARAKTDSGRFTKRYFYTVLSRVYNFCKS